VYVDFCIFGLSIYQLKYILKPLSINWCRTWKAIRAFKKSSGLIYSGHNKIKGKENSFIFLQNNLPWLEHVFYTIVNFKIIYRGRPFPLNPWRS
jgi:hypothetical protein